MNATGFNVHDYYEDYGNSTANEGLNYGSEEYNDQYANFTAFNSSFDVSNPLQNYTDPMIWNSTTSEYGYDYNVNNIAEKDSWDLVSDPQVTEEIDQIIYGPHDSDNQLDFTQSINSNEV
jgi:hypothetical protein